MRGYLEDLKAGGRPMTDKELAEHYKHLYSELKKQKDDVVEHIKKCKKYRGTQYTMQEIIILRMLGECNE